MTPSALVGFTGFVGSNLATQTHFDDLYNSRNMADIAGRSFDLLVFAGAQSKKWWANKEPEADWGGIQKAVEPLRSVSASRAVLISTIDVIPFDGQTDGESADCRDDGDAGYGPNRLRLEGEFRTIFRDALVVRLPALFGTGLKKNVIYDLIHDNLLEKINPTSTFQYYDVARLWRDIETATNAGLSLIHLFPEPISTQEVVQRFFPHKRIGRNASPEAHYAFRTLHDRLFGGSGGYIENRESVLGRLSDFIRAEISTVIS